MYSNYHKVGEIFKKLGHEQKFSENFTRKYCHEK